MNRKPNQLARKGRTRRRIRYDSTVSTSDFALKRKMSRRVIELMEEYGGDSTKPHNVDFFFYRITSEEAAYNLAARLKSEGYDCSVFLYTEGDWTCVASKVMVPTLDNIESLRKNFERLARQHDGVYDGWETGFKPGE